MNTIKFNKSVRADAVSCGVTERKLCALGDELSRFGDVSEFDGKSKKWNRRRRKKRSYQIRPFPTRKHDDVLDAINILDWSLTKELA